MAHPAVWLVVGIGSAVAAKPVGKVLRPVAVNAIKGGLIAGRELQRLTEEARAGLSDMTAEARAAVQAQEAQPPPSPEAQSG